ncbi:uncharacterized protein [Palaemon carinicauda]|uniref:uncharacterized protein n=1 Tax=Palaemon carinicauda TaxID=392227 RepID=UPI0035B61DE7
MPIYSTAPEDDAHLARHVNIVGPLTPSHVQRYLFTVLDHSTYWPEPIPMETESPSFTPALFSGWITRFGILENIASDRAKEIVHHTNIPERIVTNNGPQFTSQEFREFCNVNGIKHTLTATYHPSPNEETERFIQTFEHNIQSKEANVNNTLFHVSKFLSSYRTTPHNTTALAVRKQVGKACVHTYIEDGHNTIVKTVGEHNHSATAPRVESKVAHHQMEIMFGSTEDAPRTIIVIYDHNTIVKTVGEHNHSATAPRVESKVAHHQMEIMFGSTQDAPRTITVIC